MTITPIAPCDHAEVSADVDTDAVRALGMTRIGERLPPTGFNDLPHAEVAEVLRSDPGVWYLMPPLWPTLYRTPISTGRLAAYRPAGRFQAEVRNHRLYVQYVPEQAEEVNAG